MSFGVSLSSFSSFFTISDLTKFYALPKSRKRLETCRAMWYEDPKGRKKIVYSCLDSSILAITPNVYALKLTRSAHIHGTFHFNRYIFERGKLLKIYHQPIQRIFFFCFDNTFCTEIKDSWNVYRYKVFIFMGNNYEKTCHFQHPIVRMNFILLSNFRRWQSEKFLKLAIPWIWHETPYTPWRGYMHRYMYSPELQSIGTIGGSKLSFTLSTAVVLEATYLYINIYKHRASR